MFDHPFRLKGKMKVSNNEIEKLGYRQMDKTKINLNEQRLLKPIKNYFLNTSNLQCVFPIVVLNSSIDCRLRTSCRTCRVALDLESTGTEPQKQWRASPSFWMRSLACKKLERI